MSMIKYLVMELFALLSGGRAVRLLETDPPEGEQELLEAGGAVQGGEGSVWDVTVLKFGKSARSPHFVYTKDRLATPQQLAKFNGARVYANRQADDFGHKKRNQKVATDIVGFLSDARATETEIRASFNVAPSAGWLKKDLLFAQEKKALGVYQLSIDGFGVAKPADYQGERLPVVESIENVDVDIVPQGAAGGGFNSLIESFNRNINQHFTEGVTAMKQKLALLFTLLYPTFLESKGVADWTKVDENQMFTYLLEADKAQGPTKLPDGMQLTEASVDAALTKIRESLNPAPAAPPAAAPKGGDSPGSVDPAKLTEALDPIQKELKAMRIESSARMLEGMLIKSGLPTPLRESIASHFKGQAFTEAEATSYINGQRETYAKLFPAQVNVPFIEAGQDRLDKIQLGVDGLFLESGNSLKPLSAEERKTMLKGVTPMRSIKEAYVLLTGDEQVTGVAPRQRLTESIITGDWTKVFADALNKRMVRDYTMMNLDTWRSFVDIVPLQNFMKQHRLRTGGYANLPTVAERGTYLPLTSPTDEEATYTPAKRGGTEDITREMIANDAVGAITKIPTRLARAASQTLHEFVYDLIKPSINPTVYDSVALYHANHSNTATTALGTDGVALAAARLRMKKQTNKDNSKRLGLRAGILLVPSDLEEAAYKNLTPAYSKSNQVPEFVQQLGIIPVVVDYWTDATDWVLVARREDIVGIEIGFVNGQETPELFVSDMPNAGSLFTNDAITYKIRHEYGGAVVDYRAFDGSIVAG